MSENKYSERRKGRNRQSRFLDSREKSSHPRYGAYERDPGGMRDDYRNERSPRHHYADYEDRGRQREQSPSRTRGNYDRGINEWTRGRNKQTTERGFGSSRDDRW